MQKSTPSPLLSLNQTVKKLGISRPLLFIIMKKKGYTPSYEIGNRKYFTAGDVEKLQEFLTASTF